MIKFGRRVIGIDFGDSNTLIGYYDEIAKEGKCCKNKKGLHLNPSIVYFKDEKQYWTGETINLLPSLSGKLIEAFKHQTELISNQIKVGESSFSLQQLSAMVYRSAMECARADLEEEITDAIITIPACYDSIERQGIIEAAKIAEINIIGFLKEPTAALYYIDSVEHLSDELVLVVDFGGGKIDLLAAEVTEEEIKEITVGGNQYLGGKSWNIAFEEYIIDKYFTEKLLNEEEQYRLQLEIEKVKKILSFEEQTMMIFDVENERQSIIVTRKEFENCTQHLLLKVKDSIQVFMRDCFEKGVYDFDRVIVVGGTMRMPCLRKLLEELFPCTDILSSDYEEAVVKGAVIYAQSMKNQEENSLDYKQMTKGKRLTRISTRSYGLEVMFRDSSERKICNVLNKHSELPIKIKKHFYTNMDNQETVELKIYETKSSERYTEVREQDFLGDFIMEIPESLPKNSDIYVELSLSEDGILVVRGIDPKENTISEKIIESPLKLKETELMEQKSVIDNMEYCDFINSVIKKVNMDECFESVSKSKL